ncbi:MAG TPA: LLM class flavin-dependent oxidoreductase [Ktedonobacterales bacterium]|nr:LLM class flavin-dependent oxidoreductase [Ktedonobacterales bacterium]
MSDSDQVNQETGQPAASAPAPLKLGLIGDSPVFPGDWSAILDSVRRADELGYDSVWLGEAWGYELFTSLADLVRVTSRIKLGAGVANVFSRTPALIASTIATLDERSGGRMLLGLGTSGPQVVEHWHGVPYKKPLRRLREYTEIINAIIARQPLAYTGEVFRLERGFALRFHPPRTHVPIYIASLTDKSIIQTGAIADGVLPTYWPAHAYPEMRRLLDEGSASAGRPAGSVKIASYIMSEILLDEREREPARRRARGPIAFYIGRMGTFYAEMLSAHGFASDVEAVKKGWASGQQAAIAAVSDALLDATAIVGLPDEICARLREWTALGLDEPLLSLPQADPESVMERLAALARAAGLPAL